MGYSITVPYTMGASAVIANLLAGQPPEYMGMPAKMTIYGSADATGDSFQLSSFRGGAAGELPVPSSPIPVASTVGAVKTNENFITQIAVSAGSRLVMSIAGANTHTGRFLLVIE